MRNSRPIAICIASHIIAGWIIINLLAWPHSSGLLATLESNQGDASEHGILIATYKAKSIERSIWITRMKFRRPWKYVFYTPKFYSGTFFIAPESTPADTRYVIAANDTILTNDSLVKGAVSGFSRVPEKLIVQKKDRSVIEYFLEKKYQENIDKIPDVPFFEKIDAGPFLNDHD